MTAEVATVRPSHAETTLTACSERHINSWYAGSSGAVGGTGAQGAQPVLLQAPSVMACTCCAAQCMWQPVDTAHRREDAVAQDGADTQHHQHPQHILGLAGLDEALPPVSRLDALRPVLGAAASRFGALPPQLRVQRKGAAWCSDNSAWHQQTQGGRGCHYWCPAICATRTSALPCVIDIPKLVCSYMAMGASHLGRGHQPAGR